VIAACLASLRAGELRMYGLRFRPASVLISQTHRHLAAFGIRLSCIASPYSADTMLLAFGAFSSVVTLLLCRHTVITASALVITASVVVYCQPDLRYCVWTLRPS